MAGFFSLTADERQLQVDHAEDLMREVLADAAAIQKARTPDTRTALQYRCYRTAGLDCVIAVKHSDRTTSIEISRDGGARPHAFINPAKISLQPESSGPFIVFLIDKKLSRWVREKQGVNLLGAVPGLVGDWSKEQRATWERLIKAAARINCKISSAGRAQSSTGRHFYASGW